MAESVATPSTVLQTWQDILKNRTAALGLWVVLGFVLLAFFAPLLAPHDPTTIYPNELRLPPSLSRPTFLLGTDDLGRDLLSRLIYGAQLSLGIGFAVVTTSLLVGTFMGLLAGYFGGWLDTLFLRTTDLLLALPSVLLAIVIVSVLGPSLMNAILAVSVVAIPNFFRVVRASVLMEKNKGYVLAARSFGASPTRQIFSNILPNCLGPLLVQTTLGFSDAILNAAALGFLGLGAQPPTPEWGAMLADARAYIVTAPWLVTLPGVCILTLVLGFNLLGDGLRDILDPKLNQ